MLEQLLNNLKDMLRKEMRFREKTHIVTKHVLDELQRVMRNNFGKYYLLLLASCSLQLLLDETRTMLIAAELHYVSQDVLRKILIIDLTLLLKLCTLSSHFLVLFVRKSSRSALLSGVVSASRRPGCAPRW